MCRQNYLLSWKKFFAVDCPQYSLSLALGDPVILLPPISIHTSSLGKLLYKFAGAMSCLDGFLHKSIYSDVNPFLQCAILPFL
jgi:hypothetical protein